MCTGRPGRFGYAVVHRQISFGLATRNFSIVFLANTNRVQARYSDKERWKKLFFSNSKSLQFTKARLKGWFAIIHSKINDERNYISIFYVTKRRFLTL